VLFFFVELVLLPELCVLVFVPLETPCEVPCETPPLELLDEPLELFFFLLEDPEVLDEEPLDDDVGTYGQ